MGRGTLGRLALLAVVGAIGAGCSPRSTTSADGGGSAQLDGATDTGFDADPQRPIACRVAIDHALNPCAPTIAAQVARYQGTPFGIQSSCHAGIVFQTAEADHIWGCAYHDAGSLMAWERIESTQLCEGRASAIVAATRSMGYYMSCLTVDAGWTWVLGFDPGPTTISMQLATTTTGATPSIAAGFTFILDGREIAGSDLTFRYWYTADARGATALQQTTSCDGTTGLGCDLVKMSLVPVTPPRPTADTYLEVSFPLWTSAIPTVFDHWLSVILTRGDAAPYDQSNDHSYNGASQPTPTTKVTAYVKGALIYGTEP